MGKMVEQVVSFEKLMGTGLAKFVYYIGILALAWGALRHILSAFVTGFWAGLWSLIAAPIGFIVALLVWRFIAEVFLLLFRMNDNLEKLAEKTD